MASAQKERYLISLEFKGTHPDDSSRFVLQVLTVVLDADRRYVPGSPYNQKKKFGIQIPAEQNEKSKRLTFEPKVKNSYAGRPTKITFSVWNDQSKKFDDVVTKDVEEDDQISLFTKASDITSKTYQDAKLAVQNAYRRAKDDERGTIEYVVPKKSYVKANGTWPQDQWVELEDTHVPFTLDIDKLTIPLRGPDGIRKMNFMITMKGTIQIGNHIVDEINITDCVLIDLRESSALAGEEAKTCKMNTNCILLDTKFF